MDSTVKLMMTWDILPGKEEEYFEFHIRQFVPALENLGLILHEAWLTQYGDYPRLMVEAIIPSANRANSVLESEDWIDLGMLLEDLVENFRYKVVPNRTRWQM
ncbi:MAG TPA: hypothetical protein VJ965_07245 [Anaerolineales bacterium]|nr:hypothetical protein [Anaerolineales bacterium]